MNFDRIKPLVLTGWTFWGNSNYIDLLTRNLNKKNKYTRKAGHLTKNEMKNKSAKQVNEMLKEKQKDYDEALKKYEEDNAFGIFRENKMKELIIQELRTNNYHFTGDYHQEGDFGCPVFNDKYIYCTSCREWGEIMAEAFPDEDYDGFGLAQRYLKWAFIDDDLSNFVFPDPEKEIYKRRLESLKSKRRKNKDENSDNELIFGNEEDEDYENSEFDEDDDYDDEEDDYDYDEEEDEEDED